jgi:NADH:ubiquinone oxidoreductase subunit 5 (subunit L)/multisubunit Na+/H+ antiporter MnhA subunit
MRYDIIRALRSDEVQVLVGLMVALASFAIALYSSVYFKRITTYDKYISDKFSRMADLWMKDARIESNEKQRRKRGE